MYQDIYIGACYVWWIELGAYTTAETSELCETVFMWYF